MDHDEAFADIDLWDVEMFGETGGHDALARLRAAGRPVWQDRVGGEPFWAVTRYEDARAVLRNPTAFSSSRENGGMFLRPATSGIPTAPDGIASTMIETDPPQHQAQRQVLSPRFSRRSIGELETRVREIAIDCIIEARDRESFDFVTEVAHRIPAAVSLDLMGAPSEDWDHLAHLQHQCLGSVSPEDHASGRGGELMMTAMMELGAYFYELLERKRASDEDDLLSELVRGLVNGEERSTIDLIGEAVLLLNGSLDTTRAAGSAGGLLPLLTHRDQLAALRADPSGMPAAVEEFVRWASPIRHVARTATADVDLGGVTMRAGDRVGVWIGSANRDGTAFGDPDRYDTTRAPNPHIGFAFGEHFCLGSHLARLILRVEFEEALRLWPTIELAGEPLGVWSNFVGGLRSLPIRVTA